MAHAGFALAESLGGVESLIEVPQAMTHQSVEGSAARRADLVRLSCGIEAATDLVEDSPGGPAVVAALSQRAAPVTEGVMRWRGRAR